MSAKKKLKGKIDIIVESEKCKVSTRKLAEKLSVGRTQVNDILKQKCELKKLFGEG